MSIEQNTCRLGLISWPVYSPIPKLHSDSYIILGEIYDKDIADNFDILSEFNDDLDFLYPFKVKKNDGKIKVYNEQDFSYFRKKYKLTTKVTLHNYKKKDAEDQRLVFRTPCLYDISCMERLFEQKLHLYHLSEQPSTHCRVFIVLPSDDPVIRGQIIKGCIDVAKNHKILFLLVGDKYGLNKETTSTLMKRYLLSSGIQSEIINKSIYGKFPDSILESLEILPFMLDIQQHLTHDIFIACPSSQICKIMSFTRDSKIKEDVKIQFMCE